METKEKTGESHTVGTWVFVTAPAVAQTATQVPGDIYQSIDSAVHASNKILVSALRRIRRQDKVLEPRGCHSTYVHTLAVKMPHKMHDFSPQQLAIYVLCISHDFNTVCYNRCNHPGPRPLA